MFFQEVVKSIFNSKEKHTRDEIYLKTFLKKS